MRPTYIILFLLTLSAVIGIYMSGDPGHSERMGQMHRDAAFTAETRDMVLLLMALGIGGFIAYLTMTRR
jgi:hypothetical protein